MGSPRFPIRIATDPGDELYLRPYQGIGPQRIALASPPYHGARRSYPREDSGLRVALGFVPCAPIM